MATNPFDGLTLAQCNAYVAKTYGVEALRKMLADERFKGLGWKESFQDQALELRQLGLHPVAEVISNYAETLPSHFDESNCPYPDTPDQKTNRVHWLRSNAWRKEERATLLK